MDIPRYWRLKNQRYRLEGAVCQNCGHKSFPPRMVCPQCKSKDLKSVRFNGKGIVYSYTILYQTSERYEEYVPYIVALIDLEDGPRITAQLTDIDLNQVKIGMPVEMVIRKYFEEGETGPIVYGYKFRPVFSRQDFSEPTIK
ncbi:MAG: Zn-ribbon domain-containing OB-fold protein [Calditrichaeota bacterium]|nr:Zn-ribbon domain-containing OB-fold protein [Calditrichota bacterium]